MSPKRFVVGAGGLQIEESFGDELRGCRRDGSSHGWLRVAMGTLGMFRPMMRCRKAGSVTSATTTPIGRLTSTDGGRTPIHRPWFIVVLLRGQPARRSLRLIQTRIRRDATTTSSRSEACDICYPLAASTVARSVAFAWIVRAASSTSVSASDSEIFRRRLPTSRRTHSV